MGCSEIKSGNEWKKCYLKTNGKCDFNGWKCTANDSCIKYSEQCDGECYGTLKKCGSKCIVPLIKTASSYEYVCNDQCINNTVTCEGSCPEGRIACNGRCYPATYYWLCPDTGRCLRKFQQCNGKCPTGSSPCGPDICLCDKDPNCYGNRYYRKCGDTCVSKWTPCQKTCPSGYNFCSYTWRYGSYDRCFPQYYFQRGY